MRTANDYFILMTTLELADHIQRAENRIVYSSVGIQSEIAIPLSEASSKGIPVKVIINPAEESYRNGYGDIGAIKILQDRKVDLYEIAGNQIGFIIIDELGYFLFPESRVFIEDAEGPNAVLMDEMTILKVINHYFTPQTEAEKSLMVEQVRGV